MRLTKTDILSKSYIQIILDGFRLFFNNILIVLPFFFSFILLFILIDSFVIPNLIQIEYWWTFSLELMLKDFIESVSFRTFSIIAYCPLAVFIYEKYTKKEAPFAYSFKNALNFRIVIVWLIYAILIPVLYYSIYLGIIIFLVLLFPQTVVIIGLFILPRILSILLNSYYIFIIFTYNIKDQNATLTKTRYYRKGAFLKILIIMTIYIIIIEVFTFIISLFWNPSLAQVQSWYDLNSRRYDLIFLTNFIFTLPSLIFGTLQVVLLAPLFASQVAKKAQIPKVEIIDNINSINQQVNGFIIEKKAYCPFCGKLRKTDENFCIYCGKLIS